MISDILIRRIIGYLSSKKSFLLLAMTNKRNREYLYDFSVALKILDLEDVVILAESGSNNYKKNLIDLVSGHRISYWMGEYTFDISPILSRIIIIVGNSEKCRNFLENHYQFDDEELWIWREIRALWFYNIHAFMGHEEITQFLHENILRNHKLFMILFEMFNNQKLVEWRDELKDFWLEEVKFQDKKLNEEYMMVCFPYRIHAWVRYREWKVVHRSYDPITEEDWAKARKISKHLRMQIRRDFYSVGRIDKFDPK